MGGKSLPSWLYLNRQAPNIVTLLSLIAAVMALLQMVRGESVAAARLLLVCTALDGMDGSLARMMKLSSPFGRQLDSLADLVAFGVAPAVLVASWHGPVGSEIMMVAASLFASAGALRLARYNMEGGGSDFAGLPITAAGTALTALVLLPSELPPLVYIAATLGLAFLMVSRIPFAAGNGARRQNWYLYAIWPVGVLLCVILPQWPLAAITFSVTWAYIALSIGRAIRHHSEAPRPQAGI
ncbi:MAG: CDP-diacylglycerol--serine O-phosphatidyltransferase [Chloroflexi bacterium]|nr:CDP-diacylglycerol--serine O-phosphatidyltransferase [Chloroflexota bacterium]